MTCGRGGRGGRGVRARRAERVGEFGLHTYLENRCVRVNNLKMVHNFFFFFEK